MAKITLDQIRETLQQEGWQLCSDEYTNLNTEMQFVCSEGHQITSTWGKLRQKLSCPICAANQYKNIKHEIISKPKNKTRFLALDQASHLTGWAVLDNAQLITYGVFQTHAEDEFDRFHEVNMWLIQMIDNWQPDIIALEGIQYQQEKGITTYQTLARLQGILAETCKILNVPFKICHTATWRMHCNVKGRSRSDRKKSMQALVKKWFDVSVSDDCADAIGIGKYASETQQSQAEIVDWE